jgi:hypothetical protein
MSVEGATIESISLVSLTANSRALTLELNVWLSLFLASLLVVPFVVSFLPYKWRFWVKEFEVDQAEVGINGGKLRFKPNITDKQVAYAIWVELSTRKIGLPIDLKHDVVSEVYDSWYAFFGVTRELLKTVAVNKVKNDSTQKIINLSIDVLNQGLRPHLTRWQARFRHWYERELAKPDQSLEPQALQEKFEQFAELKSELERVNLHLMNYREQMRDLVMENSQA